MLVTDIKRTIYKGRKEEHEVTGFYMQKFLKENLDSVPKFLTKSWDCVGIVSGHGKVRIGKCQVKGDVVLCSDGSFKKIENIKIGDKIISPQKDGSFKFVKVRNIHKRFEKEVYLVKENKRNGRVLYSCAGNHLIPIHRPISKRYKDKNGREKRKTWKKLDLYDSKKISNLYTNASKITSFTTSAIEFENKKNCEIDPYSLGVYLGDGSFCKNKIISFPMKKNINVGGYYRNINGEKVFHKGYSIKNNGKRYKGFSFSRQLNITTMDKEIINEISKVYQFTKIYQKKDNLAKQYRFSLKGKFAKQLMALGLEGKGSGTKFIPKECLFSSINYRLKVLAGLIDTDGYVSKNNHINITTKSKRLGEDIKTLIFSLGGYSNIRKISKKCQTGYIGSYYSVNISFEDPTIIPLLTKRKKERLKKHNRNPRNIGIKCIKVEPQQVYGIEIEGESKWYITNNWMVTHNSTLAAQVCYYLAWRLAGGETEVDKHGKSFVLKKPSKKLKFNLKENVVFSAESLQETAQHLYDKYGKNQVILYDEGRQGLDSARTMESINRGMEDFFQECGFMGHVIIIVLPSFFKLHEDYAVARSLFLIDVFADKQFNRGFFNFYNEHQKELLFFFGKKKLGATAKYRSAKESFWGKFTKWLPFDKDEYEAMKKEELSKKRKTRRQKNLQIQRDFLIWRLHKLHKDKYKEIMSQMSDVIDVDMGERTMQTSVQRINDIVAKSKGLF